MSAPDVTIFLAIPFCLSLFFCFCLVYSRVRLKEKLRTTEQSLVLCEEKLRFIQDGQESLTRSLEGLSAKIFEENQRYFMEMADRNFARHLDTARHNMEIRELNFRNLLDPVRDMLFSYEKEVQRFAEERERSLGDLGRQLSLLGHAQAELKTETQRLVSSLRQPQVRGRWGEITLRRVVEISGLSSHCDFTEQVQTETEEGRFRPDMVVTLPGGGQVVVDAKVPLAAYLDAMEADTEEAARKGLDGHARQVAEHIRLLSQKSYWRQFTPSPEFVILFIPGESFFSAALEKKPGLLEQAAASNVLLATPSTLIAMLKTIALVWREQASYENSKNIVAMGKELHQRLLRFSGHMNRLGQDMEKGLKAYNEMAGAFQRRVLPCLRQFEDMGIAGETRIPESRSVDIPVHLAENRMQEEVPHQSDLF